MTDADTAGRAPSRSVAAPPGRTGGSTLRGSRRVIMAALWLGCCACTPHGAASGPDPTGPDLAAAPADGSERFVVGAAGGTGPSPALADTDVTLPTHTLYRPANLPDTALPLVIWGNGACGDNGLRYGEFLREIASHGFFVIALGHARADADTAASHTETDSSSADSGRRRSDPTSASQMLEAIDWAVAQTSTRTSRFAGRIDTQHIAVMGHSCGGLQAIRASADPRIATTMIFNSGVYNAGPSAGRSAIHVTKEELSQFHGPVAYISGGPADIAHANAVDDVSRIDQVPVFFAFNDAGHSGTFWSRPNGGDYARIAVAWLSWHLRDDVQAQWNFAGADCLLCVDPAWSVRRQPISGMP